MYMKSKNLQLNKTELYKEKIELCGAESGLCTQSAQPPKFRSLSKIFVANATAKSFRHTFPHTSGLEAARTRCCVDSDVARDVTCPVVEYLLHSRSWSGTKKKHKFCCGVTSRPCGSFPPSKLVSIRCFYVISFVLSVFGK
jgi:hypothetical protein